MRVLIYEGDSFISSHIADRFQKEGHDVTCIYTKSMKMGTYPSAPHTKYRYSNILAQLDKIVKNERPHIIVFSRDQQVTTIAQLQSQMNILSQLLDASVKYNVSRFIYLSDISVYGNSKELYTEEDAPQPETLDAKCHALAESAVLKWRYETEFSNVILRCATAYGQRQDIGSGNIVWKMIKQAVTEKSIREGLFQYHSIVYSGDLVDAVYRSIGDLAQGVYNITPDETVKGTDLAAAVSSFFPIKAPEAAEPTKKSVNADNTKAKMELGFVNRVAPDKGIEHCYNWYKQNPKTKNEVKAEKAKKTDRLAAVRYVETIGFFVLAGLLNLWQSGWSAANTTNFLILYIIIVAVFLGINYAVLGAILVSIFNIYLSVANGMSLVSSIYDLNTMIQVAQNLLIGISIGYVVERKNNIIDQKQETIETQATDLEYLNVIHDEMGEVKAELEVRISEYEDSYAKINYIMNKLNSVEPDEVFVNSLDVIKELIHEENISLYILDKKSKFVRRVVFTGEECKVIPKTFRLRDYPKLEKVIDNKEFYANSYMDTDMPSMIVPIVYAGNIVSIIVIDKMHFEKLNLYYVNLIKIITNLINSAFYRAHQYEQAIIEKRYILDTPILLPSEFKKQVELKRHIRENLKDDVTFMFSVIELEEEYGLEQTTERALEIAKLIRDNDQIGLSDDGKLRVLLAATGGKYADVVIKRLLASGIAAHVVRDDVRNGG